MQKRERFIDGLINSKKYGVVLKVIAWNVCTYLCVFVYCRSFLSFLVYVFTVNTVLFAALDAK